MKKKTLIIGALALTGRGQLAETSLKDLLSIPHNMATEDESASLGFDAKRGILIINRLQSIETIKKLIEETDCKLIMLEDTEGHLTVNEVLERISTIEQHRTFLLDLPMMIKLSPELTQDIVITSSDEYNKKSGKHFGKKHKHKNKRYF